MNTREVEEHEHRYVVVSAPTATVKDVADAMARKNVGSVVIVEGIEQEGDLGYVDVRDMDPVRRPGSRWEPVGIITDRDIVLRVVHTGKDPEKVEARDIMSTDLVTVEAGEGLPAIVRAMDRGKCRRVLLVEEDDLLDIVTLDDVLRILTDEMDSLARVLRSESSLRTLQDRL